MNWARLIRSKNSRIPVARKRKCPLIEMDLRGFADETASKVWHREEDPLRLMSGLWEPLWGRWSPTFLHTNVDGMIVGRNFQTGQKRAKIKDTLLQMVDEDTASFNGIINAMRMPKSNEEEKAARQEAIQAATKYAIEVPFKVMELAFGSFELIKAMASIGNPNSVTDAAVGDYAHGQPSGSLPQCSDQFRRFERQSFVKEILEKGQKIMESAEISEKELMEMVEQKMP